MVDKTKTSHQEEEEVLRHHDEYGTIPCEICLKEIPQSLAKTQEADEYVMYFCGLECHEQWMRQKKTQ